MKLIKSQNYKTLIHAEEACVFDLTIGRKENQSAHDTNELRFSYVTHLITSPIPDQEKIYIIKIDCHSMAEYSTEYQALHVLENLERFLINDNEKLFIMPKDRGEIYAD